MRKRRKKPSPIKQVANALRQWELRRLRDRMKHQQKKLELKASVQKSSNSLLWVWEFSKKAVLICFLLYVTVQLYSMIVMVYYQDFSCLGELIGRTAEITQNCVFAYLIKAGLENIGKIWFSHIAYQNIDQEDTGDNEPVG